MKNLLILLILVIISIYCQAQTTPTDTAALYKQWEQESMPLIVQELSKVTPLYITYFTDRSPRIRKLNGFIQGGRYLDSRKLPMPEKLIIFATIPRAVKEGKK